MQQTFIEIQSSQINLIFYLQHDLACSEETTWHVSCYIINYIEIKYYVSITYIKTWNAKTKRLMIFEDWESSYETLPQYLDVLKQAIRVL